MNRKFATFAAFCLSATAIGLASQARAQTAPLPNTMANPGTPQSNTELSIPDPANKTQPGFGVTPRLGIGTGENYDRYLQFKQTLSDQYNLDIGLDFSLYAQAGVADGGKTSWLAVYYPYLSWRPFTNTTYGTGKFDVTFGKQDYFNSANTGVQASRLGLITFPNDWVSDNFSWSKVAYTHTLPDSMNWLSITVGQYNLFTFDPNTYAGNAQTTFIGYDFAQDATQTFPNAGLGSYLTAKSGPFQISGGFQGATNLSGRAISTRGFETGKYVGWGNFQWAPDLAGLGAGIYSLLVYEQPAVPNVSTQSTGISFSASQKLSEKWGAFMRINHAGGSDISLKASIAAGGVRNDPFGHSPTDQAGIGLAWDQTNPRAVGMIPGGMRGGEWGNELYYSYTVTKGLSLTPDVQVFWNPALLSNNGPAAVFTIRTTLFF
jgi:hypothetical protein